MEDLLKPDEKVDFDQTLYEKNIKENEFPEYDELDGFGVDEENNNE